MTGPEIIAAARGLALATAFIRRQAAIAARDGKITDEELADLEARAAEVDEEFDSTVAAARARIRDAGG